jgi:hypothetical protein
LSWKQDIKKEDPLTSPLVVLKDTSFLYGVPIRSFFRMEVELVGWRDADNMEAPQSRSVVGCDLTG